MGTYTGPYHVLRIEDSIVGGKIVSLWLIAMGDCYTRCSRQKLVDATLVYYEAQLDARESLGENPSEEKMRELDTLIEAAEDEWRSTPTLDACIVGLSVSGTWSEPVLDALNEPEWCIVATYGKAEALGIEKSADDLTGYLSESLGGGLT